MQPPVPPPDSLTLFPISPLLTSLLNAHASTGRNVLIKSNAQSVAHLVFHGSASHVAEFELMLGTGIKANGSGFWPMLRPQHCFCAPATATASAPARLRCLWQPSMMHQSAPEQQIQSGATVPTGQ